MIKRSLSQIRTDSRNALAGNYSVCFIALFFMFIADIAISQIMYLLPLKGAPGVFVILTDVIYSIPGSLIMTMLQAGFLFLCLNSVVEAWGLTDEQMEAAMEHYKTYGQKKADGTHTGGYSVV